MQFHEPMIPQREYTATGISFVRKEKRSRAVNRILKRTLLRLRTPGIFLSLIRLVNVR